MNTLKIYRYYLLSLFTFLLLLTATAIATTPPPLQLANTYHDNIDLTQYWVSEKLDGVRAYWNGQELISRQGNTIHAPDWFTADFPTEALDGELWIGRHQFELVSGVIRQKQPNEEQWRQVRFMVFDMPNSPDIFTQRIVVTQKILDDSKSPYLQWVTQYRVDDHQTLMAQLDKIVKEGGEGLMLRRGDSQYQAIRNDDLLKVKAYEDDEATVIAYTPGRGKYIGMMGALVVENADKVRFNIGSGFSDEQRRNPPKIGSTITYMYFGKTKNNLPRFASFIRIREETP